MAMSFRKTRCLAKVPANCLDIDCLESRAVFNVPRDHAKNDHRATGWYAPEMLLVKEIGDPIPVVLNRLPDYVLDMPDGTSGIENLVIEGLLANGFDPAGPRID